MRNKKISIFLCSLAIFLQISKRVLANNSFTAHLGDNSNIELWLFLMFFSLCGLILTCLWEIKAIRKKNREKN